MKRHMFKDLEQEQLIINHSLAEECRKHNINFQLIKLVSVLLNAIYSESTIDYNIKYSFSENEDITKRYKSWLKKKSKKLNDLQSQIILKVGSIRISNEEYAGIEEKILIPARLKLINAENIKNIKSTSQRESYIKKLNLFIDQHESNFLRWKKLFRPHHMEALNGLRKEYVNVSLETFEIPIRNNS
jgi:hypothetical protein